MPTLISQIRKRGREYEMNIDELYLKRLNDKYKRGADNGRCYYRPERCRNNIKVQHKSHTGRNEKES